MDFGISFFPTDETVTPGELGRMAEERGFRAVLFAEHSHIQHPPPAQPAGGELPRMYLRTYDPFVALADVAAATSTIQLGTGVCLVSQRDPIHTAKEVASVDRLSGGRFLFGVGTGWNEPEMRHHGTDPGRRFGLVRERIEAMKALWTEEVAEYHGRHVDFGPVTQWPKPAQEPHPPILVGGVGEKVLDRVLAYGDGWIPNRVRDPAALAGRIEELRRRAAEAGRGHVPVTVYAPKPGPEMLEGLAAAGVDRVLWWIPSEDPGTVERELDARAEEIAAFAAG